MAASKRPAVIDLCASEEEEDETEVERRRAAARTSSAPSPASYAARGSACLSYPAQSDVRRLAAAHSLVR